MLWRTSGSTFAQGLFLRCLRHRNDGEVRRQVLFLGEMNASQGETWRETDGLPPSCAVMHGNFAEDSLARLRSNGASPLERTPKGRLTPRSL